MDSAALQAAQRPVLQPACLAECSMYKAVSFPGIVCVLLYTSTTLLCCYSTGPSIYYFSKGVGGLENGQFCWRLVLYLCWHSGWAGKSPNLWWRNIGMVSTTNTCPTAELIVVFVAVVVAKCRNCIMVLEISNHLCLFNGLFKRSLFKFQLFVSFQWHV